jgi:integrase
MGPEDNFKHFFNVDKKQTLSKETPPKLNNLNSVRRYLKKYDLLNNKYLINRNGIYYFVFYFEKDTNKQFSLKTSNFLLANIIKYKIITEINKELNRMKNEDFLDIKQKLILTGTDNTLNIVSENEEEKQLIKDITQKTIRSIKQRKIKKVQGNIDLKTTRKSKNNIKKHIDLYIKFLKLTNNNQKTIHGYIKKFEVLIDYFNHIKVFSLNDITKKHCKDLQLYLLSFPSNMNKFEELKGKNIFELIDKSDIILDKYEKLNQRTVDNYITRYKTLFNYFLDNDYVYSNHFLTIKNLKHKIENPITNFQKIEDVREQFEREEIELLLENIKEKEIKDLIVVGIITGARINEILNLKIIDILKTTEGYFIDIKKSKTYNGVRKIPIHKRFKYLIEELIKNKKDNNYLLFNEVNENRIDKIQKRTMYQIRKFIKNKNKVFHSFRKNFTQELYKSNIEELYIKLLLGHTLKDNLSFNTYNLSKIDNETLQQEINKVNFKRLFENTEYDLKNIEENNKTHSIKNEIKKNNLIINI